MRRFLTNGTYFTHIGAWGMLRSTRNTLQNGHSWRKTKREHDKEQQNRESPRVRGFEKGLADRGGWRKEIPPIPWIRAFFCPPFPIPPYDSKNTILGDIFCCILGAVGRQPPPANPFSKPLRGSPRGPPKTSERFPL